MTDIAIKATNISKVYHLYDDPVDRLKEALHPMRKKYHRDFYALNELSFEVKKGETVGIVGKNGSGKSTLLKVLTGVLTPTRGNYTTNGRVLAILELGAGFNPELTGLENVYFSGTLFGAKSKEIDIKLDEILEFADIGEFIHQPVKTYSSGMYVRLAFSIIANMDADVLIVDEALSVGDIAFQNKCITKIKELRDGGASILFVSHDMSTLQLICDRVLWINDGQVVADGEPTSVCQEYYVFMTGATIDFSKTVSKVIQQQDTGMAKFLEFKIDSWQTEGSCCFVVGQDISFKFRLKALSDLGVCIFAVSIYRADGDWLIGQTSREEEVFWPELKENGYHDGSFVLQANCLAPGEYLAAFGAYAEDHSICYALTDLTVRFSVRSNFPMWGKFHHPSKWIILNE